MKPLLLLLFAQTLITSVIGKEISITREETNSQRSFLSLFSSTAFIKAYAFSSPQHRLIVVDEGDSSPLYGNLRKAMSQYSCVAGVNGGFFYDDDTKSPIGLVISNGKLISPVSTNGFMSVGILYDTGKTIKLERRQKLSTPLPLIKQAIQSGPFLVENGKVVAGLNNSNKDKRTFVATDGKGKWLIGISSALTLRELANWLAESPPEIGFIVVAALNLDGGSSTAFYNKSTNTHYPSLKRVRNYIGIQSRSTPR